jgi:C-terminal processing protease CtpA/Prc
MGASELVAAVLQETKKVKVIGTGTPGLVSRQELFPLQDESSVLVTSGVFTLASGKKLWEEGVTPDEKIGSEDQSSAAYLKKTASLFPSR